MALTDRELYTYNEQSYIAASDNLFKRYYPSLQRVEEIIYSTQGEPTREQRKQHALLAVLAASTCTDREQQSALIAKAFTAAALLTLDELLNTLPLNKQQPGNELLHYRSSSKALARYRKQHKLVGGIGEQHIRNVLLIYANEHVTRLLQAEAILNLQMRRALMLL